MMASSPGSVIDPKDTVSSIAVQLDMCYDRLHYFKESILACIFEVKMS